MEFEVRLVHAEAGRRIVEARALISGRLLGSSLGEAEHAEEAEDRAVRRLRERLGSDRSQPVSRVGTDPARSRASAAPPKAGTAAGSQAQAAGDSGGAGTADHNDRGPGDRDPGDRADPGDTSPAEVPRPIEAPEDRPADPEDWSEELTRLELALRRIGWSREQEGDYLRRAFGHPSRSRLTSYADLQAYLRMLDSLEPGADPSLAAVPLRRGDLIAQSDALLSRLGWDQERARQFSEEHLGVRSRSQLSDEQLLHCNMLLESELISSRAGAGGG